jgi:Plavaka transposase
MCRLPARYQDIYPEAPHPAASSSSSPAAAMANPSETAVIQRVTLVVRNRFQTAPNTFGLWKEYLYRPSYDPDASISPEDLYLPHTSAIVLDEEATDEVSIYTNKSTELLMNWQNSISTQKSNDETTRLVHGVLFDSQFRLGDLKKFNATYENRKADAAEEKSPFLRSFREVSVNIDVPSGSMHDASQTSQTFTVSGLHYRQITTLIKETFESPISKNFHFSPFKLFRKHPNSKSSDRIYSEIYNLDVLLDEHDKVQRAPTGDPTCKREKVVAALMFWSDATHLATFGTAKMWPIYLLFGNLSKYIRCQPNSGATRHLAYIPPLPDSLQDQLKSFHRKWDTQQKDILTHCRRELIHAVWKFILDEDFLHAYTYGMVVRSLDGIERRVYPRILTYSADYPEKYAFSPYVSLWVVIHQYSLPSLG